MRDLLASLDMDDTSALGPRRYAFPMIRWADKMLPGGLEGYPNVQMLQASIVQKPLGA